jgi:hypothetical protein
MTYKHDRFTINTGTRKVYDEYNKELRITGNAYRVLVFLCRNGASTVTQIGDFLDHAKNYSEDHIRQYRYKINTILSADIIKYENKLYRIDGEVLACSKVAGVRNEKKYSSVPPFCKGSRHCMMTKFILFTVFLALFHIIIKGRRF